jgi:hypothetical protein
MFEEGKSLEEIYDSGSFPKRTVDAIRMQIQRLGLNSFVQTIRGSFVQQIEPAKDAMYMEEVVKLFSTAFEQIYGLSVVEQNFYCKFI